MCDLCVSILSNIWKTYYPHHHHIAIIYIYHIRNDIHHTHNDIQYHHLYSIKYHEYIYHLLSVVFITITYN